MLESNAARRIKFRHLTAFVAIARAGRFKEAAERLSLTQPAISKTVKDLEDILGLRLFERDRRGARLTSAGEVFSGFAEQSIAALGHGLASLDAMEGGAATPLRIGVLPSVAANLLPDAILRFSDLSPSTQTMVEDGPIENLIARLRVGELDLVVGRLGRSDLMTGLTFTQLYSEHIVFAVAGDHPETGAADLSVLDRNLVLYPPKGAAIRPMVDRFMISEGVSKPAKVIETVSGAFGRSMTLGPARAIWIISESVVAGDVASGRMQTLPIDTSITAGPIGIVSRTDEDPTPPMRLFRQALRDTLDVS